MEPRIKGEGIRQFAAWYVARFGQQRLAERVATLPASARATFDPSAAALGVISSAWYPARSFHALIDAMLADYGPTERRDFARAAAKATVEASVKGVYKLLFDLFMTPDRYATRAQALFDRFYDAGTIAKSCPEPNWHRTVIRGWTGHHPILCDVMLYTGEYVYPALGCKDVVVTRRGCLSAGQAECSYDVRWK